MKTFTSEGKRSIKSDNFLRIISIEIFISKKQYMYFIQNTPKVGITDIFASFIFNKNLIPE